MRRFWTKAEIELLEKYFLEGVSERGIAEKLGRSVDAITVKRGKLGLTNPKGRRLDEESVRKRNLTRKRGSDSHLWKGGRRISSSGYVEIFYPEHRRARGNGYVFEHILVVERSLGRELLPHERVHHIDKVKTNNEPSNLEVMTQAQHASGHAKPKKLYAKPCGLCGTVFHVMKCQLETRKFCSHKCAGNVGNQRRWAKNG